MSYRGQRKSFNNTQRRSNSSTRFSRRTKNQSQGFEVPQGVSGPSASTPYLPELDNVKPLSSEYCLTLKIPMSFENNGGLFKFNSTNDPSVLDKQAQEIANVADKREDCEIEIKLPNGEVLKRFKIIQVVDAEPLDNSSFDSRLLALKQSLEAHGWTLQEVEESINESEQNNKQGWFNFE